MRPDLLGSGSQQVPGSPSISSGSPSPPQLLRRDGKKFIGCSPFEDYELTTKLGEGTFGEVHKAVHKATGAHVALKRVLMHNEKEGLPITAIREIKLLKSLNHPNIVPLSDMLVRHEVQGQNAAPSVYMVFPYMAHDLTGLLENPTVHLRPEHIKLYLRQLLEGTAYLHASRIMHRDMKASNLLIDNEGRLYIADFGLARSFNPDDKKDMTKCVVTRWYRPPELLLGERKYSTAIDMWGIGCIFAEMLVGKPVFQGSTDLNQIEQVMRICGSPHDSLWPGWRDMPDCKQVDEFTNYPRRVREEFACFGDDAADLLDQLLQLDPRRRPDAATALSHRLFFTSPFPARFEDMPKFEHSHEFDRRKQRQQQRQQQQQQNSELSAGHQPAHMQHPPLPPHAPPHHHQQLSQRSNNQSSNPAQLSSPVRRGRDSSRSAWREDSYSRPSRYDGYRDSSNRDYSSRRNHNHSHSHSSNHGHGHGHSNSNDRTSAPRNNNSYHPYSRNTGGGGDR
ncbi:serine/threonine protein kinase, CMGC, CDC2/CDK sub [Coemansia aciculifera]|uniref:Serine/threonine protein kinase, CMGC, CDC2/CDK sub n=1 Tax=Coemansia aciculifera TaxID=417176 RepID=A0ACC1M4U7_9FUNG|nr:serine/threonine protein kinase, CMGC, CDC2/CDK sub [Coemansia aciculifera]KAJ2909997.1 serine/threonine protein kinase, CMGC, CDC2/CDK sub [Coemansia aciculifera]